MRPLDEHEQLALAEFLRLLAAGAPELTPKAGDPVLRGPEGQVIVPVSVSGGQPSLSLALLMAQKAEMVYRQTGCRFVLAQRPRDDPERRLYWWTGQTWQTEP